MSNADKLISKCIDSYRIDSVLHAGAFATVYKGLHIILEKPVAIKVLNLGSGKEASERLKREALHLSQSEFPGILKALACGELENGQTYLVTEFMEGGDLKGAISSSGGLDGKSFHNIFSQVIPALARAHELSIIHRDLKPSNILLDSGDLSSCQAKIADFGLSLDSRQGAQTLTQTGKVMGTPRYMSPEQCRGEKADFRCDLYSLGLVMYECICGHPPFEAESALSVMSMHLHNEAKELPARFPKPLRLIIAKCLSKKPEDRPSGAAEIIAELNKISAGDWEKIRPGSAASKGFKSKKLAYAVLLFLSFIFFSIAAFALLLRSGVILDVYISSLPGEKNPRETYEQLKLLEQKFSGWLDKEQKLKLASSRLRLARTLFGKSRKEDPGLTKEDGSLLEESEPNEENPQSAANDEYLLALENYLSLNSSDNAAAEELGKEFYMMAKRCHSPGKAADLYLKAYSYLKSSKTSHSYSMFSAYRRYALSLQKTEQFESAIKAFKQILPGQEEQGPSQVLNPVSDDFRRQWGLDRAKQTELRADILMRIATAELKLGRVEEAEKHVSESIEIWNKLNQKDKILEAKKVLADSRLTRNPALALLSYEELLAIAEDSHAPMANLLEVRRDAAQCCVLLGQRDRAKTILKQAVEIYSTNRTDLYGYPEGYSNAQNKLVDVYMLLLDLNVGSKDFSQLVKDYESFCRFSSSSLSKSRIDLLRARDAIAKKQYPIAEKKVKDALSKLKDPSSQEQRVRWRKAKIQALELQADLSSLTGRKKQAEKQYFELIEFAPARESFASRCKLGLMQYRELKDTDSARKTLGEVYKIAREENLPVMHLHELALLDYASIEESAGREDLSREIRKFVADHKH